ncbi:MAG: septum formation initiator family protein [Myxococcales bacterium]
MTRKTAAPSSGVIRTALGFSLLAALLVIEAAGRIGGIEQGFALSKLQAQEESLSHENARLKLEILTLRSPRVLERLAREKLGMAAPAPDAILHETGPRPARARVAPSAALAERR